MKLGYIASNAVTDEVTDRLLSAHQGVAAWSSDPEALAQLRQRGARVASSAAELTGGASVLVISQDSASGAQDVLFGSAGIFEVLDRGTVVVHLSSGTVRQAQERAERLAERGVSLLEVCILSTAARPAPDDLGLLVSGPSQAYEQARPLLETVAAQVIHCGTRPGDAAIVRSIDQAMAVASGLSSLEAVAAGRKMGLTLRSMAEVFVKGSGRNYTTRFVLPALIEGNSPQLAPLPTLAQDLDQVVSLGIATGIPTPITSIARGLLHGAGNRLAPNSAFQDLGEWVASMAGTVLKDDDNATAPARIAKEANVQSAPTIGYVGLGAMGTPLARRLSLSYKKMQVFDVRHDLALALEADGAVAATDLPSLARQCDVILLCVPSSAIVSEVLFGKGGLAEGLSAGKVVIDQTTGDPDEAVVISARLQKLGVALVDAPVSGGPETPAAGTAVMICGGPDDAFDRVLPILKAIGPTVIHCGPVGSGHAAKLVNNASNICNRLIAYEAAMIGFKNGIKLDVLHQAVNRSVGWSFAAERVFKAVATHAKTASISLDLSLKDIASAVKMGIEYGAPMMIGDTARNIFALGVHQFGGEANVDEMALLYERMASIDFTSDVKGGTS